MDKTNKTKVTIICNSPYNGEYKDGDIGYVDGYIRGADNIPYAVVIVGKKFYQVPIHAMELNEEKGI